MLYHVLLGFNNYCLVYGLSSCDLNSCYILSKESLATYILCLLGYYRRDSKEPAPAPYEAPKSPPPIEVPALSLEELKEKTDNFGSKALIGEGSYGRVYFANLNNGKSVAVKKLDVSSESDSSIDFLTQVCLQI